MATTSYIIVLCLIHLSSEVASFIFQKDLNLKNHNFAFLTSFCGKPTGTVLEYNIEFPKTECCPSLLSYYETQWWQIWPDPHKNCTEKQSVLRTDWGQILHLRLENPTARCKAVPGRKDTSKTNIVCKGKHYYYLDIYNPKTPKCWFIAANNCRLSGLRIKYTFNVTGAYYNQSQRNHKSTLEIAMLLSTALVSHLILSQVS